jgi:hypothetical protein
MLAEIVNLGDMVVTDNYEKPEGNAKDAAHLIIKAGLSAVPFVGGPLAEFFAAIINPPLQKRREKWVESIAEGLQMLQEKMENFKLESLSQNEAFITTAMHASNIAIRNHQEEKLEALRNAVLNSALPNAPEDDLQAMFLGFIDDFSPGHLRILKLFDDPRGWFKVNNVKPPEVSMGAPRILVSVAYPDLQRDFYDQFVTDLYARGLSGLDSSGLHTMTNADSVFTPRTTTLGQAFLKFISKPPVLSGL